MVAIASSQSAVADILSELLDQPIKEPQIQPLTVYLATLSAILVGVTHADRQVTEAEKQRLGKILAQFISSDNVLNEIVRSLVQGVRSSKIYAKPADVATLASQFAESEKLLLIALGYDLATADGALDSNEQKYLRITAQHLGLKDKWLVALEAGLVHQQVTDALEEVCNLLDPARFQCLDSAFAKAASQVLSKLPQRAKPSGTGVQVSYEALARFQAHRTQLTQACRKLGRIVLECHGHAPLPQSLTADLKKIVQRLQSQKFRVAVVGEFSQGKSTLLNALLGEEIQPTRVIPCSGSITVLRYGEQKRVVVHYRNGTEESIPLEAYQARASIPDEIALGDREVALTSDILEIVYEHPDLVLCRQGVELIDSPGLNEHPERTRLTQQLLENVDAVIFLANGSRPMTQGERELLQSLKLKLNGGQSDQPAHNLFVVVNFMDLLRREHDRQQVRKLVENFVFDQSPILATQQQLHFVSAQAALDAMIEGETQNEYLQAFRGFTQALETFLTQERGASTNRVDQSNLQSVIKQLTSQLAQAESILSGKVKISDASQQNILNSMGEASGYLANLQTQIQSERERQRDIVQQFEVKAHLENSIRHGSAAWVSEQGSKNKVLKEFGDKFQSDLSDEIEEWTRSKVLQDTLAAPLKEIDSKIQNNIARLRQSAEVIDQGTGSQLAMQLNLSVAQVAPQFQFHAEAGSDAWEAAWDIGIGSISGLGGGGLLAGGIALAVSSVAFFPLVLTTGAIVGVAAAGAALGTALGGAIGFLTPPDHDAIKREVIEKGLQQFYAPDKLNQLRASLDALVTHLFDQRLESIQAVTHQYITLLDSLLIDSETAHSLTLSAVEAEQHWYQDQRNRLADLESQMNDLAA